MFKRQLLSRAAAFNATHGIKEDKKDYLSITKNQGNEGLCWAYALTSTIETNYALKTGNRLMLDPTMLKNKSVPWWKDQSKKTRKENSECLEYGEDGSYIPGCAVNYLYASGDTMIQQDGQDSFLQITGGGRIEIKTLQNLYDALDNHGVLYSAIFANHLNGEYQIISKYIDMNEDCNHAIVITAVGHLINNDDDNGIYVEILNSWGYNYGYDGLVYVKIADSENGPLMNNMNMFYQNIFVEVSRTLTKEEAALVCAVLFGILFGLSLIVIGILIFYYWRLHKKIIKFDENTDQQLNA